MTTGPAPHDRRVYGTLDGLRGVAAISVVVLHAPALFGVVQAPSAGLAVDLFFVMSGFIIAHAYEGKMRNGMTAGHFILIRLIRLYPLFLVGLGLGVVEALAETFFGRTQAWTLDQIAAAAAAGLLMLPAPPTDSLATPAFRLNPPSWSLFFEMVVNIAYALLLPKLSDRVLGWAVALSGAGLVGIAATQGDLHVGSSWDDLAFGLFRVSYSFFAGVLIFRHRGRIGLPAVHPLAILALAAAIFFAAPGAWTAWFESLAVLVLLPVLVMLAAATEPGPRLVPGFKFLGETSYAVYSLHYPILLAVQGVVRRYLGEGQSSWITPWAGLAMLALLLAATYVVDRVYDSPVRRRLTRLLSQQAPAQARTS